MLVAATGSGLCIWHDPNRAEEASETQRRAVERAWEVNQENAKLRPVEAEDLPPPLELDMPALLRRLAWVHQQVAAGKLDPDAARELRGSIREMRLLIRDQEIEERLREALAELKELRRRQNIRKAS